MKKLILLIIICILISCKKDAKENIADYNWVISSATINPAITSVGRAATSDYISYSGCIDNLTFDFLPNGVYTIKANSPACDYMPNTDEQKWTRSGDKIIMKYRPTFEATEATLSGNKLTYTDTFSQNNISYTVNYTFKAQKK